MLDRGKTLLAIIGGEILTPRRLIERGVLIIAEGKIAAIGRAEEAPIPPEAERIEAAGLRVIPGLVDRHLHGGGGGSAAEGAEGLARMARFLASHGVTAFLPTCVSAPLEETERFLAAVKEAKNGGGEGARVLGAHLEGPYLNPEFKGAHEERFLRAPSLEECERLLARFPGVVKLVTLAPELPGALDLIAFLIGRGVTVALGHSNATLEQVEAAIEAGATGVTHTYNAMRPFHHREPGLVGAALTRDELDAEIVADFVHVHPAAVEMLLRCKPPGRVVLVSDSISAAGLSEGEHEFGGRPVTVERGAVRLETGRLAGSVLTLERAVANIVSLGFPPRLAIRMATLNPARSLRLRNMGVLRRGARADLAILDREWKVRMTVVGGRVVFRQ